MLEGGETCLFTLGSYERLKYVKYLAELNLFFVYFYGVLFSIFIYLKGEPKILVPPP